jgi:hypothetical protein
MPRLLELFSGTGSMGRAYAALGWDVTSLDLNPYVAADITCNLMHWDYSAYSPTHFDCVHASPPCTSYSCARTRAKTPRDLEGSDALVVRVLEIIAYFQPTCYTIENPWTGLMRKREVVQHLEGLLKCVSYCKYGSRFRKHTAVWSNLLLWSPKPACSAYMPCAYRENGRHPVSAQRAPGKDGGVRRATASDHFDLDELYAIPAELCAELAEAATRQTAASPRAIDGEL